MAQISGTLIIKRELLTAIADERVRDARALLEAGRFAGAIYIGGYAVECYLKAAICRTLDLDDLPKTFAVHDLELLLMHSGLQRRIEADKPVHDAFRKIQGMWSEQLRYEDPRIGRDSDGFLSWVNEVVQWIKPKTS